MRTLQTLIFILIISSLSYSQSIFNFTPCNDLAPAAVTGAYFNGCSYLFYRSATGFVDRVSYSKIYMPNYLTIDFVGNPLSPGKDSLRYEFPFKVGSSKLAPAPCVFEGRLFLFFTDNDDRIKFTSTDGNTWSDPVFVEEYKAVGTGMSASVLGNKLYLAKQNSGNGIGMISTSDMQNWSSVGQILSADNVGTDACVSTCTYTTSDDKEHILISVNPKNLYILTMCYDKENGYFNDVTIPGAMAKSARLVEGSFRYLTFEPFATIQIFITGTDNNLWGAQYLPESNSWINLQKLTFFEDCFYDPGVFTAFSRGLDENSVQKTICIARHINMPYGLEIAYDFSDQLKRTETVVDNCDKLPGLWSLVGVVEGPPPYVLNGSDITQLDDPPSIFEYGSQSSSAVVNSSQWTVSTSTSVNIPVLEGVFSAGIDISAAVKDFTSTSYEKSYTVSRSVEPGQYALGYYYFLKPQISRYKYERYNFLGGSLKQWEYIFAVTEATLTTVDFELKNFDPANIQSYLNKAPSTSYKRLSSKGFNWTVGSPWLSEFCVSSTTEHTAGFSLGIEASAGVGEIFEVTAGIEIEVEETHTTVFGESISICLDNPNPRPGHTEDVKAYSGTAYWLQAESADDYWIPHDLNGYNYKDQRPWLVTWDVTDIQYNNLSDVENESKIPDKYSLGQNYPNPFNPSTVIEYSLPGESNVNFSIYNTTGERIFNRNIHNQNAGRYTINIDGTDLSTGVYFYVIEANASESNKSFRDVKKMILLK